MSAGAPVWTDAQLSPALAGWMRQALGLDAHAVRDLGLRDAEDPAILARARVAGAVVLTKRRDLVDRLERHGPPPQVVWLTCGNTSNAFVQALLARAWPHVAALLAAGEPSIEVGGRAG